MESRSSSLFLLEIKERGTLVITKLIANAAPVRRSLPHRSPPCIAREREKERRHEQGCGRAFGHGIEVNAWDLPDRGQGSDLMDPYHPVTSRAAAFVFFILGFPLDFFLSPTLSPTAGASGSLLSAKQCGLLFA